MSIFFLPHTSLHPPPAHPSLYYIISLSPPLHLFHPSITPSTTRIEQLHDANPKHFWEQKQSNEPDARQNDPTPSAPLADNPTPAYDDVSGPPSTSADTSPRQKHEDSSAGIQAGNNEDGIICAEEFEGPPILDDKGDYEEIDNDVTHVQQNSWLVLQKSTEGKQSDNLTEPHSPIRGDVMHWSSPCMLVSCSGLQFSLLVQVSFCTLHPLQFICSTSLVMFLLFPDYLGQQR